MKRIESICDICDGIIKIHVEGEYKGRPKTICVVKVDKHGIAPVPDYDGCAIPKLCKYITEHVVSQ